MQVYIRKIIYIYININLVLHLFHWHLCQEGYKEGGIDRCLPLKIIVSLVKVKCSVAQQKQRME